MLLTTGKVLRKSSNLVMAWSRILRDAAFASAKLTLIIDQILSSLRYCLFSPCFVGWSSVESSALCQSQISHCMGWELVVHYGVHHGLETCQLSKYSSWVETERLDTCSKPELPAQSPEAHGYCKELRTLTSPTKGQEPQAMRSWALMSGSLKTYKLKFQTWENQVILDHRLGEHQASEAAL